RVGGHHGGTGVSDEAARPPVTAAPFVPARDAPAAVPLDYVRYAERKDAVYQLVSELEQVLKEAPRDKRALIRAADIGIHRVLELAVGILDNPAVELSANFMTY